MMRASLLLLILFQIVHTYPSTLHRLPRDASEGRKLVVHSFLVFLFTFVTLRRWLRRFLDTDMCSPRCEHAQL